MSAAPEDTVALQSNISDQVVIELTDVNKWFGDFHVLKDINLSVNAGERIVICGPSGSGKSTLIRCINRLEEHQTGDIIVNDTPLDNNLKNIDAVRREVGMVFQQFSLFPWLTVKENVMFGLQDQYPDKARRGEKALVWIERVGLGEFVDYYPNQLSGGMQQRVAIARALAPGPKVLLMDEPFAALDAQTRGRMQRHLLEIWRNLNITVVFITHDLEEAVLLADKIFVLAPKPGRLVATLPIEIPRTKDDLERDKYGPEFERVFKELSSLLADSVSLDH